MMKFKSILLTSLLAGFAFASSACGDDDEKSNESVVGTWRIDEDASTIKLYLDGVEQTYSSTSDPYFLDATVTFNEDGTLIMNDGYEYGTYVTNGTTPSSRS